MTFFFKDSFTFSNFCLDFYFPFLSGLYFSSWNFFSLFYLDFFLFHHFISPLYLDSFLLLFHLPIWTFFPFFPFYSPFISFFYIYMDFSFLSFLFPFFLWTFISLFSLDFYSIAVTKNTAD